MTNTFDQFDKKENAFDQFDRKAQGRSDAAAAAFGQGATFNFGDELTAAVRAALPGVSDWMMRGPALQRDESIGGTGPAPQETSKASSWKERYEEELAKTRGQMKANREAYPNMIPAGEIAGNVATTALALPASVTAAAPTLLGNIVKMGLTGAGLGGLAGFGEGEGLDDRAGKAAIGALFGGATGAAVPVASVVGRAALESKPGRMVTEKVVSPLVRAIASKLEGTPLRSLSAAAPDGTAGTGGGMLTDFADATANVAERGAIERLATAAQRANMDTRSVGRQFDRLGPEAMFADVDPQFLSAARMANTMPGATRSRAKIVLEGRDRGAGSRLTSAFEGSEPAPSAYSLRGEGQAFDQNLRAVGARVYGDMEAAGLKQTPELMALYENPNVAAAIDRVMQAEKATRVGTGRAPASPVEIMHKVKQAIWDLGFDGTTARPGPMASWYRDLGTAYVDALKRANPALAEADRAYAQAASLPEYFDAGANLLKREATTGPALETSAPALGEMLGRADPQQVLAARTGATNVARSQAQEGTDSARALAKRIDTSTPVRDKIVQLYGSPWATKIMGQAGAERQFAETSNEILRGSKTADKIAEILDTGNTAVRVGGSGITGRVLEKVDDLVNKIGGPNEAVRDAIGRITLNPNSEENRRVLALIADVLQRRASGRPLAAGAAGATGGGFAGGNP